MEDFSKYNANGTTLRRAQLRMLDILIEIDKICKNNNIDYWLDAGTLIGAVRHKGFIPWDDDIDICVKRNDYKRLRECMIKELPDQFVFTDWKTDANVFDKCGRVKDKFSNLNYPYCKHQKEKGIFVDILIVEETIPLFKKNIDKLYGPVFRQVHNFGKFLYTSNTKRIINKSISLAIYPFLELIIAICRVMILFRRKSTYMLTYSLSFFGVREADDIFPLSNIEFENYTFAAPKNTDAYLRNLYGDYMKIPEESKRQIHSTSNIEFYN